MHGSGVHVLDILHNKLLIYECVVDGCYCFGDLASSGDGGLQIFAVINEWNRQVCCTAIKRVEFGCMQPLFGSVNLQGIYLQTPPAITSAS